MSPCAPWAARRCVQETGAAAALVLNPAHGILSRHLFPDAPGAFPLPTTGIAIISLRPSSTLCGRQTSTRGSLSSTQSWGTGASVHFRGLGRCWHIGRQRSDAARFSARTVASDAPDIDVDATTSDHVLRRWSEIAKRMPGEGSGRPFFPSQSSTEAASLTSSAATLHPRALSERHQEPLQCLPPKEAAPRQPRAAGHGGEPFPPGLASTTRTQAPVSAALCLC